MNYKDKWVTDEHGKKFVFTVEMQRRLSEKGLPVDPANLAAIEADHTRTPRPRIEPRPRRDPRPMASETFAAPETIQIDPQTGKYIGRMKWYNVRKGYGFIVRGGGEEIFFHKSGAIGEADELQEGQWILYDVEETHKGPEATDVEPYTGDVDLLA